MEKRKPEMSMIAILIAGIIALLFLALVLPQIIPPGASKQIIEYKKFQSQNITENAVSLELSTFNGYVAVIPIESNTIIINITMRGTQDELKGITFDFKDQAGNGLWTVALKVKSTTILPLSNVSATLDVFVPKDKVYNATLDTSNGYIDVSSLKGEKLILHTSNGMIQFTKVEFTNMELTTSNGAIRGSCSADKATLSSSNGAIIVSILNFGSYDITTSNGRIEIDTVYNAPLWIQAKTSNGKISYNMPLNITQSNNNSLLGNSNNYDPNKPNISLNLSTSNGNIDIYFILEAAI
jgi:hypothetical protein